MKAEKDSFPFLSLREPWTDNPNNVWLASTLAFNRNIKNFPFPNKLPPESLEKIRTRLAGQLSHTLTPLRAEELGPLEKEFLFEHFLSPHNFQRAEKGQGFMTDPSGRLFVSLNMSNHIRIQITDTTETLEESWRKLVEIETSLSSPIAFSSRFGYLTANPMECGTAMTGRLYLHVPALIHTDTLDQMVENLKDQEVETSTIHGDILIIRNRCTVGLTEENILEQLRTSALKVTIAETRSRKEIAHSENPNIKDKVARAYGLALHSYQLEAAEAWGALSLLKLGLDIGWLTGITHQALNELFFTCRRAHLVAEYGIDITQEELPHRRAEYLHGSLSNAQLTI